MVIKRFYCLNSLGETKNQAILEAVRKISPSIKRIDTEICFHIESIRPITSAEESMLRWLLKNSETVDNLTDVSELNQSNTIIEIGPRFNFSTAYSTNCVSICLSIGLKTIKRIEYSIRYNISGLPAPTPIDLQLIVNVLGDRMTQCLYNDENKPIDSFDETLPKRNDQWFRIPVLSDGRTAIETVNQTLGLSFDDWDLDFYTDLFRNKLKRDPTTVELFDCAQSNSEHSRHWFFKGRMIVDGVEQDRSLIDMIAGTQRTSNPNNTIKFSDNSSAIIGYTHPILTATNWTEPDRMVIDRVQSDLIFTAETHNMPTAVAPFSGATTGTGGRIRDVQGVGRGGHTIAGTAGYCVGCLNIPGYRLPYEESEFQYPDSFASPLQIIIEASNGASDYGNKFGEPVVTGFAISYGLKVNGERQEYVKPIMFSGGLGTMNANQTKKIDPERGMLLAKIGGPVYRIGVGGGAASSVQIQGENSSELDFNAVQRGDAEMENKLNRVVRACIEMGPFNPILAIHDQGAGGNGNVLKELVEPGYAGAIIFAKEFQLGDPTITALELWGAEYQENNAILCAPESRELLENVCARERCPISFVGFVTGNGHVQLIESQSMAEYDPNVTEQSIPFDMNLRDVLGDMPRKIFNLKHIPTILQPLQLPSTNGSDLNDHLTGVLSILSVGSKRFLTNKVDRCVTGLVAQQQCVGPLHTPLSDYAVTAVSHFGYEGIATAIGTQPLKGLIDPRAAARLSVTESLTNLVFARISNLSDVKCSGNWMWPAKLPGEGWKLYETCQEMCEVMGELGIAVDGGKDSLSMAARVGGETIKSPGTLVISTYAPCPDIRCKVTPDLKRSDSQLIWISLSVKFRLGGSALAQSFGQQGNDSPTLDDPKQLKIAFNITQQLLSDRKLLSGHDISDGGLVICLLEMALGGWRGLNIDLTAAVEKLRFEGPILGILFAEEPGWILEVNSSNLTDILNEFGRNGIQAFSIGQTIGSGPKSQFKIRCHSTELITGQLSDLMKQWERTSFEIEKLQMNPNCARTEYESYDTRIGPTYHCTIPSDYRLIPSPSESIKVAVIREEGTNGDREMIATLIDASFEVHDVTMSDLHAGKTTLDRYRGVIFPGGFSYADTLGSAKGWAGSILFSESLRPQFDHFKQRPETFSLGVCNGCQLMSLIGWIGGESDDNLPNITLQENESERYECRWSTVTIPPNKSVMLTGLVGSRLGCWIAHGEGRFSFKTPTIYERLKQSNLIAMEYVDDGGRPTETYPMNPNGSLGGTAAVCSEDGRHLAMMPHPERCSRMWQWPYIPDGFEMDTSPWQFMFDEAYRWCLNNF